MNNNNNIKNGYGSLIDHVKVTHPHDDDDINNINTENTKLTTILKVETGDTVVDDNDTNNKYNDVNGTATSLSVILAMTKGLVGSGALSLPNGISLYTNTSNIWYVMGYSTLWIIIMGIIFGYYCYFLGGKLSTLTGNQYTYRSIWDHAVGNNIYTSILVSIIASSKAFLAVIAYASILTDTAMTLFQSLSLTTNHPILFYLVSLSRTEVLSLITISTLTPLCFIKNTQSLSPFSIIGTIGIILTTIAMFIRYYDGTYSIDNGGIYYQDLLIHKPQYIPNFYNTRYNAWTTDVLPYVCMVYEVRYVLVFFGIVTHNLIIVTLIRETISFSNAFGVSCTCSYVKSISHILFISLFVFLHTKHAA